MKYYSDIKRNEAPIQAKTWMNIENIILSDRKPDTEVTYCMVPLM